MPRSENEVVLKVYLLNKVCKSWCGHRRKGEQDPYEKNVYYTHRFQRRVSTRATQGYRTHTRYKSERGPKR